jgi:hypothetical protein
MAFSLLQNQTWLWGSPDLMDTSKERDDPTGEGVHEEETGAAFVHARVQG